jgi:hypothetical protein
MSFGIASFDPPKPRRMSILQGGSARVYCLNAKLSKYPIVKE